VVRVSKVFLDLLPLLFLLSAAFGYINHRIFRLPHKIGLVVIGLCVSLAIFAVDTVLPVWGLQRDARALLAEVDFSQTLLQGALSFLLFAGALNVNLTDLFDRKWSILAMATLSTFIATAVVAFGMWGAFLVFDLNVPLTFCFVFGALIAPTDPLAVLGIIRKMGLPKVFEAEITGESLFNDGVAIVIFSIALSVATGMGEHSEVGAADIAKLFATEAFGGIALGLALGYVAFVILRSIDEYNIEILITLALVTTLYSLSLRLGVSGPLAVVVAGLLIGNHGTRVAMSETTRRHVTQFWSLLDEILNSLLFVLIGFEVLAISREVRPLEAILLAIPLVLAARLISLLVPLYSLGLFRDRPKGTLQIMTWGGLHGGISVALALSLPPSPERDIILTVAYGVVIFSIVVQGLTIEWVARRWGPATGPSS
jgi:NhaP-type Na+/H+ and K+/H+ antiporters